jgi:hypothetical protein
MSSPTCSSCHWTNSAVGTAITPFAEFLRARLEREQPQRCASAWYQEQGYVIEAGEHALVQNQRSKVE